MPLPLNGAGEKTYKLEYYTDGEGFAATPVQTIYYKVVEGHTVTFDANGGSYPDGTTAVSKAALHGMAVSAPDPLPKKQGFGVTGWYKDKACSAGQAWNFATDTVIGDMTLYAQWTAGADTPYKVEHYQQNIDETYPATAIYSEEKTGTTGALLSVGNGITPRTDAGFEYDKLEPASPAIGADGKTVVKVYYKRKTYTVNFSVDGSGGTISAVVTGGSITSPSSASVKYGGSIAFTATPTDATQHKVGGWSCTPSAEGFTVESGLATASLTVTAKATVSVQFVPLNALTVKKFEIHGKDASNGSVSLDYKDAQIAQDDIKLEFNEHSGLTFTTDPLLPLTLEEGNTKKLTINVAASQGNYPAWSKTVSITRAKNDVAKLRSFTLNGETKTAASDGSFASEYEVASEQAEVKDFIFDANSTGATASVTPAGNVSIPEGTGQHFTITVKAQDDTTKTIEFTVKRKKYTVTFSVENSVGGTIKARPEGGSENTTGSVSVEHGKKVTFTAAPARGWHIDSWKVSTGSFESGGGTGTSATLKVTAEATVTVKFEPDTAFNLASSETGAWKILREEAARTKGPGTIVIDGTITATGGDNAGEITLGRSLTIEGKSGSSTDILDAAGLNRIFKVSSGTLTLKNLTLKNGMAEGPDGPGDGGAIYVHGASVNITNCTLTNHTANKNGGAVYATKRDNNAARVTISGGFINGNMVTINSGFGGGIYINDGCKLTLTGGVEVNNNKAARGGGVRANNSDVIMNGCTFEGNKSTHGDASDGCGGVYVNGGTVSMKNCILKNNDGNVRAGGLLIEGGATVTMKDCTLTGNTATTGGGVYVQDGTFKMSGSAVVTPATGSEANDKGKNDVYLVTGQAITVDGTLSNNPAARITPELYKKQTVLKADSGVTLANEVGKFTVTPDVKEEGIAQAWKIDSAGKLEKTNMEVHYDKLGRYLSQYAVGGTTINRVKIIDGSISKNAFFSWGSQPLEADLAKKIQTGQKRVALTLPDSIKDLTRMQYSFQGCDYLVSLENIPSSVTEIQHCFENCKNLTQAPAIPSGVGNMTRCFSGCEKLTQAPAIPSGVTSVENCFSGCTALTQGPDIPSSVGMMYYCFDGCTSLKRVKLMCNYHDSPTSLFENVFKDCTALVNGGIKVPQDQLQEYKNHANKMGVTDQDKFVGF